MWDPDAVNAWTHDEELLSWRSFDTTQWAEADAVETQSQTPFDQVDTVSETTSGSIVYSECDLFGKL